MLTFTALGYIAATLTTLSFVPQVWKTYKSRSARDLSLSMLLAFSVGVFLWLVYGLAIGATPVAVRQCSHANSGSRARRDEAHLREVTRRTHSPTCVIPTGVFVRTQCERTHSGGTLCSSGGDEVTQCTKLYFAAATPLR